MRLAFIAPLVTAIREPQLGGSQALLADIASGLAARGHDVAVFAATGSAVAGVRTVDVGVDPESLAPTLFRAGEEGTSSSLSRDAFAKLYRSVAVDRFDVIHNHAFDVPAIDLAPADAAVVHTLHLPPSRLIADALGAARLRSRSVTVAAVSRYGAATWQEIAEVDVVLPNGVPVDRIGFSPSGGTRALFAGRFSPEKGALEAIEIAQRAGVEIVLVGNAYDERYTEQIWARGAEILDAVGREPLWRLMGASSAVLCPALWDEPFGLVAAEAQATGTPVVAFARGALGEVVRNGETGYLATDIDDAVIALKDVARIDRSVCRSHAERNLSLDRTLDAHEALYRRLAGAAA